MESTGARCSMGDCYICLDEVSRSGRALYTSNCAHTFHHACIAKWTEKEHRTCPVCRTVWNRVPLERQFTSEESSSRLYFDDEPIAAYREDINSNMRGRIAYRRSLTIQATPEFDSIQAGSLAREDLSVLVSLKACSSSSKPRPIDLVFVLDVSASMRDRKLELMKNAMNSVIQDVLRPEDRLSIVTFSATACRLFPLLVMGDQGKERASQQLNNLSSGNGTNISDGLKEAEKVLRQRNLKNPVSSIILVSDGEDNMNEDNHHLLPRSVSVPVYTFGIGCYHNAKALHSISEASGGTYSFIQHLDLNLMLYALRTRIAGLTTVEIQELEVTITSGPIVDQIISIQPVRDLDATGQSLSTVWIADMYAAEEKNLLVLTKPRVNLRRDPNTIFTTLLEVNCSYKDPISKHIVQMQTIQCHVQVVDVRSNNYGQINYSIVKQRNRINAVEAIKKALSLADSGELGAAKNVVGRSIYDLRVSALVRKLQNDLIQILGGMENNESYERWGCAFALCSLSSHSQERATVNSYRR